MNYWCFISYCHVDNATAGREWATWLHQGLETYRVPSDIVGKRNNRGETIPERIFPVFRDEEELPSGDLLKNIRGALSTARSLVVICSRRTPSSTYVAEEIRFYEQLRARELRDGVEPRRCEPIVAIIDGDPHEPNAEASCIPPTLRYRIDHEGRLTDEPSPETLWTDFRLPSNAQGWTSPTPYRAWLESDAQLSAIEVAERVHAYSERIETARLRIIAGILGVTLGELQEREESYRLAEARRKLFESSFLLSRQSADTSQAIAWLWRSRHALDDDDPRVDLVHAISQYIAERLPDALVHDQRVTAAAFTPDGAEVVTASDDGLVRFWRTAAGTPIASILAHPDGVTAVCVSPDGAFTLAGSQEGSVFIFDTATHSLSRTVSVGEKSITALQFDASGDRFLAQSGSLDGSTIGVFSVQSGELAFRFDVAEEVFPTSAVALSPAGDRVLMGGVNGSIVLLDIQPGSPFEPLWGDGPNAEGVGFDASGDQFYVIKGACVQLWRTSGPTLITELKHEAEVLTVAFAPNGATIATGGRDGAAWIWSTVTGDREVGPLRHNGSVTSLRFDRKGQVLVTCSDDQTLRCWSLPEGSLLQHVAEDWQIRSAEFDRSGDYVVSTSDGYTARLWRREPSPPPRPRGSMRHERFVIRVNYSSDGSRILTSSEDGTSRLWANDTLEPQTQPLTQFKDDIDPIPSVVCAAFSPNGKFVATGSTGAIDVWDARSGQRTIDTIRHPFELWALQFSPDSKLILSSGRYGAVHLWDVSTGERAMMEPLALEGPRAGNTVFDAQFSPDGACLAAAIETRKAVVWRLGDTPALIAEIRHGGAVERLAFSPDGLKLATGCRDGNARVYNSRTGEPLSDRLTHGAPVRVIEFSPEGRLLVTGSDDHSVRVWDAMTGSPIRPPIRLRGRATALCFRHDGTMFATADGDGGVRVWESTYGTPVTDWLEHPAVVGSIAFHPGGREICTGCKDGRARVWSIVPADIDDPARLRWFAERKTGLFLDPERIGDRLGFENWRHRLD